MAAGHPRQIISIQYLRAIAALAVVAHHTTWTRSVLGAAGVDLFFIISGFVMVHVSGRESDPRTFLRARLLRLVPIYWVLTVASALYYGVPHGVPPEQLISSLLFWPHDNGTGGDVPVIPQGWSLNFEMFFYVLFALGLLLPARVRIWALSLAFAALTLAGAWLQPSFVPAAVYTSPIMLEFLAGAWIRVLMERGALGRPVVAGAVLALGSVLLLAQAGLEAPAGLWRPLLWGGACALVVAGAVGLELAGRVPAWRGLKLVGDSSYSIYLIQFFVLGPLLPLLRPVPTLAAIGVSLAACIVVGVLVRLGLELPLLRLCRRVLGGRRRVAPAPAIPTG